MVESGNLLPQEEESEHSHHSIESVRGTKVLDLSRKRAKIQKSWRAHSWLQPELRNVTDMADIAVAII